MPLTSNHARQLAQEIAEHQRFFYMLRRRMVEWGFSPSDETLAMVAKDEFDAYNDDLLRVPAMEYSPDQEFAKLSVLDLLLSPTSAMQFCDRGRNRLRCPLVDSIILRVLWQNRDAIDAVQNSQN